MLLQQILEATQYTINSTTKYEWDCYGLNAHYLDFIYKEDLSIVSCIYDAINQTVYEVTFSAPEDKLYRWINPEYIDKYLSECKGRNVLHNEAYDDILWNECKVEEDILNKITSFYTTGTYDEGILTPINLTEHQWGELKELAEFNKMTVDEFANIVLREAINNKKLLMAATMVVNDFSQDKDKK